MSSDAFKEFLCAKFSEGDLGINEVSRRTGISAGYISKLLNKEFITYPSAKKLRLIADATSIDYLELLRSIGYVKGEVSKPDLYQLILAGLVRFGDKELNFEESKRLVKIIDSVLGLKD